MTRGAVRVGLHPGQVAVYHRVTETDYSHTRTPADHLKLPNVHVFGLWEDAGGHGESPHRKAMCGN